MALPRIVLAWLVILALAIANGGLREAVLRPWLGDVPAQIASGLLLMAFILIVAAVAVPRGQSAGRLLGIGALWLVMTLAFEFGFGLVVQHKPLAELLDAYTLRGGNLWLLVVIVTFLAPCLVGWRHRTRAE